MEPAAPRSILREIALDLKHRWLRCSLGLLVLALAFAMVVLRNGPKVHAPRVVILATGYSNGEQVVTFRPDPPSAEITSAELVAASDDGKNQPPTVREFGQVVPVHSGKETNFTLHFVAIPKAVGSMGGRPLACTPGSYTVAYTPSKSAHRVRVGVALEQNGIRDYLGRLRNCWERKSISPLHRKTYRDAFFVTTEPFTNAAAIR